MEDAMSPMERDPFNVAAGERLEAVRKALDMTQEEFARRAGITPQSYSNYATGLQRVSLDAALKLRRTYRLDLEFIYFGRIDDIPHKIANALRDMPLLSISSVSNDR